MKTRKTLPGFTLIELAVVLIIIGVIAGAILKGQSLLEEAKIRSTLSDLSRYHLAVTSYQETYGAYPGDDKEAKLHLGDTAENGDGDRKYVSAKDKDLFWKHLAQAGYISSGQSPSSKLGGKFSVISDPSPLFKGHYLMLAGVDNAGVLTPQQAQILKAKADDGSAAEGIIRFMSSQDADGNSCLTSGGDFNLGHKRQTCILLMKFH